MKLKGSYKASDETHNNIISLGDVDCLPRPGDIIEYIERKWLVLEAPYIWNLNAYDFMEHEYTSAKRTVTIQVEQIK